MDKVICIVGPTGIGKTKLSLALAHYLNTEIINGDAIQVFKQVDILSAKIPLEEQEGIKHHLIDCIDISESFDVARFKKEAGAIISELNKQNIIPILVGGSGLYVKSLLYDYTFDQVAQRDNNIIDKYKDYSNEQLFSYLKTIDEDSALILHPNNRKRVLRAIEIFEVNKISKTDLHKKQKKELEYDALVIGLNTQRDVLYDLINKRVDKMLDEGLLNEVENINKAYPLENYQAMQAIGYKEFIPYLQGEIPLKQAIEDAKQNSRRYAKKQLTWFRNQMNVSWLESNIEDFDQTINEAKKIVKDFIENE